MNTHVLAKPPAASVTGLRPKVGRPPALAHQPSRRWFSGRFSLQLAVVSAGLLVAVIVAMETLPHRNSLSESAVSTQDAKTVTPPMAVTNSQAIHAASGNAKLTGNLSLMEQAHEPPAGAVMMASPEAPVDSEDRKRLLSILNKD